MVASRDKETAEELRALTRMTISPNVIDGGTEPNVIPGTCVGRVDARLVPGQDLDDALQVVNDCTSGLSIQTEVEQYSDASLSPSKTGFYDALQTSIRELAPDCSALPQLSTGMSDSHYWRALGSVVYGFVPMSPDTKVSDVYPGIHGPNERANIQSLEFATRFLCKVAPKILC
jgi:carboxypeptidase PM20D1